MMVNEAYKPGITAKQHWNFITVEDAADQCAALVPQGDLPVNALWQAMLRQAEGVASNWTGGSVGSGELKTDLSLPNGATFYDVGDSLWEFVTGVSPGSFSAGDISDLAAGDTYTFTINGLTGNGKYHFGPSGTGYTSADELGVSTNRYSADIMRGGDSPVNEFDTGNPGAFGVAMNHSGEAASDVGFRCACPYSACSD